MKLRILFCLSAVVGFLFGKGKVTFKLGNIQTSVQNKVNNLFKKHIQLSTESQYFLLLFRVNKAFFFYFLGFALATVRISSIAKIHVFE